MINSIPVVGWAISFLVSVFLSIPFYVLWNNMAPLYFRFLPDAYMNLPFWHCVQLFMLCSILKCVLLPRFGAAAPDKPVAASQEPTKASG